jgi:hypothetical protein
MAKGFKVDANPVSTRSPDESAHLLVASRRGLAENGTIEGQNVTIEYRWALGQYDRLPALAAELVRRPVACSFRPAATLPRWQPRPQPRRFQSSPHSSPIRLGAASSPASAGQGGNVIGINVLPATLEAVPAMHNDREFAVAGQDRQSLSITIPPGVLAVTDEEKPAGSHWRGRVSACPPPLMTSGIVSRPAQTSGLAGMG